jgi:hypothetical protein
VAIEPAPAEDGLAGPNILLMGGGGTGKTYSVASLVEAGVEVFYLSIEQGIESLFGYWTDKGKPIPPNLHWRKIEAPKLSFQDFAAQALRINTLSLKTLAEAPDPNRNVHNLWIKLSETLFDFPDDRTGQKFGPVDSWGPERALVIDGLTGMSKAAMSCVVGSRPVWNPMDYQVGQKQVEGLLRLICDHCRCWFVLLAHVEKEIDPVLGGQNITASTIGKALAPILPPMFSDVVYCKREGNKWTWNTAGTGVDTKARNLPWADGMAPSFAALHATWLKRYEASLQA